MAVRAQKVEYLKSTKNSLTIQILMQFPVEQLPLVVALCLFHAFSALEHAQLRPEVAIILQFYVALAI